MRLTARERAPIDRLLSGLLAREIDAATWERLQAAPVTDFFERALPGFREWIEALETDADVDAAEPLRAALLDRWLRDFGAALEARAQSPLYAAVGATLVALQSGR